MQSKPTNHAAGSPVPGVIPETVEVHDDQAYRRVTDAPPSSTASRASRLNPRRDRGVLAKVLSRIRRDRHPGNARR